MAHAVVAADGVAKGIGENFTTSKPKADIEVGC
jgi:hypothetical protein